MQHDERASFDWVRGAEQAKRGGGGGAKVVMLTRLLIYVTARPFARRSHSHAVLLPPAAGLRRR